MPRAMSAPAGLERLPVLQEVLDAAIRQRVFCRLEENLVRHGGNIRSRFRRLDDMQRVADAGREDERTIIGRHVAIDLRNIANDLHAVLGDVVQTPDERADDIRPRQRGEERLIRREAERHIRADAFPLELFHGGPAVRRGRHLHDDIRVPFGEPARFIQHSPGIEADCLGADGPVYNFRDLLNDLFMRLAARLAHERGIGGHAAENAPARHFANLINKRGIEKDAHSHLLSLRPRRHGAARIAPRGPAGAP